MVKALDLRLDSQLDALNHHNDTLRVINDSQLDALNHHNDTLRVINVMG